jgi:hypothetical protein
MKFLPLILVAIFAGLSALGDDYAKSVLPSETTANAERAAEYFLAYRNAVVTFQRSNPGFTGSVSAAALAAQGNQFSPDFLATAGNGITAVGSAGRVITVYASLLAGAGNDVVNAADNDASIGVASGSTWTSYTGGEAEPLAIAVPNGAVVSVIQMGN